MVLVATPTGSPVRRHDPDAVVVTPMPLPEVVPSGHSAGISRRPAESNLRRPSACRPQAAPSARPERSGRPKAAGHGVGNIPSSEHLRWIGSRPDAARARQHGGVSEASDHSARMSSTVRSLRDGVTDLWGTIPLLAMDVQIRAISPSESTLIFSFLTLAARMQESGEPIQKALRDPELTRYWQNWGRQGDLGVVAESESVGYPVSCAWVRLFTREEAGADYVGEGIPELAIGTIPKARGLGIGTRILRALLRLCRYRYPGVT